MRPRSRRPSGGTASRSSRRREIGGQLDLARRIPGKEEFHGLVAWYRTKVARAGIETRLGRAAVAADLEGFDEVIIATGVRPRDPGIPGQGGPNVVGYANVLQRRAEVGARVAIVGAGGIGFDVADFLVTGHSPTESLPDWLRQWGVADPAAHRGGLHPDGPRPGAAIRQVTLLQRKAERPGRRLGRTTGWIHRAGLKLKDVRMIGGVNYERIDAEGLHITFGATRERPELIAADTVVLCAGQVSERSLADDLVARGRPPHVIGGADVAAELDAKRAIDQGMRLAARL